MTNQKQDVDGNVFQYAFGTLRNFSVLDRTGQWVATIQAASLDKAVERVPVIDKAIQGGLKHPVRVCEHHGTVHTLWFGDAWFLAIPYTDRERDFDQDW